MKISKIKQQLQNALEIAGVTLNGPKEQDIQILDERALKQIFREGSLGLGESYMEGWWDCPRIDALSFQLCNSALDEKIKLNLSQLLYIFSTKIINYQTKYRSKEVAQRHYNLDNQLFELMLGETMAYSCAYWQKADNLNSAQLAKYDLICKKLYLKPEDRLLDIGCGWGGLAAYAAEHYGCEVVGISIASSQISYAKERYQHLPIQFYMADYRDPKLYNPQQKKFTKLVSVGAFEHVGYKNYLSFFKLMRELLDDKGLFLLHTIGTNKTTTSGDPWLDKYIFPNGCLPSMLQLTEAMETLFVVEDWHNFGAYYDKTLLAWHQNFENHWDSFKAHFDIHFYRMWRYYLLICAGAFRSRKLQLWQIVASKSGLPGGYQSLR